MGTLKREGKRSWKGSKEVKGASKVVKDSDMICDLRFCHKRTKKNNTKPPFGFKCSHCPGFDTIYMKCHEMLLYYWVFFLFLLVDVYYTICKSPYWFFSGYARNTKLEFKTNNYM
jgi:hypothetical protein